MLGEGHKTSEFKLTRLVVIVGACLEALGIILETMQGAWMLHPSWLPSVLVVVGALMIVVKALGYERGRVLQKLAAISNGEPKPPPPFLNIPPPPPKEE